MTSLIYESKEFRISPSGITIGRGEDNDLVLLSEQASRHHARVWEKEGTIVVRDLGSKNGTFVNGRRISGDALLRPGDRIHIAGAVLAVSSTTPAIANQTVLPPTAVSVPARRSKSVAIIGAVLVLVCLVGAGVSFLIGRLSFNPAPTSVAVQPSLTPSPTYTAQATATIQPTATPTIQIPTSTPTRAASTDTMSLILKSVVLIDVPVDNSRSSMAGSGTVVHAQGYVLTNAHVVRDDKTGKPFNSRDLIYVLQGDDPAKIPDRVYRARVVAADADLDVALLKVEASRDGSALPAGLAFSTMAVGDSDSVQIGQEIRVIGFPGLGGDTVTTSRGIVSGFVENGKWIKTDTEINPGNSGGAAVNAAGELIGIPSGVVSGRAVTGKLGYILPINKAKGILAQIK